MAETPLQKLENLLLEYNISLRQEDELMDCFVYDGQNSYALDEDGQVIALNLRGFEGELKDVWDLFHGFRWLKALNLSEITASSQKSTEINLALDIRSLEYFSLRNSKSVKSLSFPKELPDLKWIDLADSGISYIETYGYPLPVLEYIDLTGCLVEIINIETLVGLVHSPKLRFANLSKPEDPGTNFKNIRTVLRDLNDLNALKAYLREVSSVPVDIGTKIPFTLTKTKDYNALKVNIVGWGKAGKTTLLHYLIHGAWEDIDIDDRTHGIEVHQWNPIINDKQYDIRFWDYGGQDYYHGTHQLFLQENNFYIVLWSNEAEIEGYAYWLGAVRFFAKENPMPTLLIQSKVDANELVGFDSQKLKGYNILQNHVYSLSVKGAAGALLAGDANKYKEQRYKRAWENFKDDLLDSIVGQTVMQATIPEYYDEIKNDILGNDVILPIHVNLDEFKQIFRDKIPQLHRERDLNEDLPEGQRSLAGLFSFLENVGAIRRFEKIPGFEDKIYLNPPQLARRIYAILDKEMLEASTGKFSSEDMATQLEKVLNETKTSKLDKTDLHQQVEEYLAIMLYFKLIFELKQADTTATAPRQFVAPQYLNPLPTGSLFSFLEAVMPLSFTLYFEDYFHLGAVFSMIASFAQASDDKNYWRYGVVFKLLGLQVLVYAHEEKKSIKFRVQEGQHKFKVGKYLFEIMARNEFPDKIPQNAEELNQCMPKSNPYQQGLAISTDEQRFAYVESIQAQLQQKQSRVEALKRQGSEAESQPYISLDAWHHYLLSDSKATPKKVFLSYSHKDEDHVNDFLVHQSMLKRQGLIDTWYDRKILPGDDWNKEIQTQLEQADIIIFMLSPDFLASDYIWNHEYKIALKRHEDINDPVTIIPVRLRRCDHKGFHFNEVQFLPRDNKTKAATNRPHAQRKSLEWVTDYPNPDDVYTLIIQEIRHLLESQHTGKLDA